MKTLPHIEDYIELMARHYLSWPMMDPVIKMARYDEPIVTSMSEQIARSQGFTDKQAALAHKIVIKYRKQWIAAGYDVAHLENTPAYRLPCRIVDRSQRIDLQDREILIRFPYNQDLISALRSCVETIPGRLMFDSQRRLWTCPAVEPRLIWAKEFGAKYNFEFGVEFDQRITELLATPDYAIELDIDQDQVIIRNAESTLLDYINERIGLDINNLVRLVDAGSTLAYSINARVRDQVQGHALFYASEHNETYEVEPDLAPVIEYATLTQRWPIYVYESGSNSIREKLQQLFTAEEMLTAGLHRPIPPTVRCVYFTNWKQAPEHMPLLITSHTLAIGHRRQQLRQTAEKIVYFTHQPNANSDITNT